jgi:hypothetical protein
MADVTGARQSEILRALEEENQILREKLEATRPGDPDLRVLKLNQQVRREAQRLYEENQKLSAQNVELAFAAEELEDQIKGLKARAEELSATLARLEAELAQARQQAEEAERRARLIEEDSRQSLLARQRHMEEQLEQARAAAAEELASRTRELREALESRLSQALAENERLQAELLPLREEARALRSRLPEVEGALQAAEAELKERLGQLQALQARAEAAEAARAELEAALQEREQELAVLRSRAQAAEEARAALEAELAQSRRRNLELQEHLDSARDLGSQLEAEVAQALAGQRELEDRLQQALAQSARLEEELAQARDKIGRLEALVAELREAYLAGPVAAAAEPAPTRVSGSPRQVLSALLEQELGGTGRVLVEKAYSRCRVDLDSRDPAELNRVVGAIEDALPRLAPSAEHEKRLRNSLEEFRRALAAAVAEEQAALEAPEAAAPEVPAEEAALEAPVEGAALEAPAEAALEAPVEGAALEAPAEAAPEVPAEEAAPEAPAEAAALEAPVEAAPEAPVEEAALEAPAEAAPEVPAEEAALEAPVEGAALEAPVEAAPEAPVEEAALGAPVEGAPEVPAKEALEAPAEEAALEAPEGAGPPVGQALAPQAEEGKPARRRIEMLPRDEEASPLVPASDPQVLARIAEGKKLQGTGRFEEALEVFLELTRQYPDCLEAQAGLFYTYADFSCWMEAHEVARRLVPVLSRGPESGRFLKALRQVLRERIDQTRDPANTKRWLLELAELYLDQPAEALAFLRRAQQQPEEIPEEGRIDFYLTELLDAPEDRRRHLQAYMGRMADSARLFEHLREVYSDRRLAAGQPAALALVALGTGPREDAELLAGEAGPAFLPAQELTPELAASLRDVREEAMVGLILDHLMPRAGLEIPFPSASMQAWLAQARPAPSGWDPARLAMRLNQDVFRFADLQVLQYQGSEPLVAELISEPAPVLLLSEQAGELADEDLKLALARAFVGARRRHYQLLNAAASLDEAGKRRLVKACRDLIKEFGIDISEKLEREVDRLESVGEADLPGVLHRLYGQSRSDEVRLLESFLDNSFQQHLWGVVDRMAAALAGIVPASYAIARSMAGGDPLLDRVSQEGFQVLYRPPLAPWRALRLRLQRLWREALQAAEAEAQKKKR